MHLSRHAPPALNARGEGRWERVLVCVRTEGWAGENGRSAPRSHSPSLGAAALSARSGAESRAPPGAGERPLVRSQRGSRPHRDSSPRRAPLTRPRPPAAASGGRGAGREARGCAAPPPVGAGGGTERPGGRERKPDRPAAEELHATGGRPGQPGLGLVPFLGGSLTASADGPEAAALSWQAEGCLPRPPARRGPRMRGGDARGQGRALSPGAAAAGRALCPWGPGARQLPGFHLPPAGPRQTPAPRPR